MNDPELVNMGPCPANAMPTQNFPDVYNGITADNQQSAENESRLQTVTVSARRHLHNRNSNWIRKLKPGERQIVYEGTDAGKVNRCPHLLGAQLRRKRPAKYSCDHADCAQTFTTAFRLKSKWLCVDVSARWHGAQHIATVFIHHFTCRRGTLARFVACTAQPT